jgi:hypothetical protein
MTSFYSYSYSDTATPVIKSSATQEQQATDNTQNVQIEQNTIINTVQDEHIQQILVKNESQDSVIESLGNKNEEQDARIQELEHIVANGGVSSGGTISSNLDAGTF